MNRKKKLDSTTYLNIMDGFQWNKIISSFPHIAEAIFERLDDQSLISCRLVEKSWKNLIDGRNYPWERIVKKNDLEDGNTYLHLAAKYGQTEMFENIFNKETEKNPKNQWNETPFHFACKLGHFNIAEVIVKNSTKLNIDLNVKDCSGFTGFHLACNYGQTKVINQWVVLFCQIGKIMLFC